MNIDIDIEGGFDSFKLIPIHMQEVVQSQSSVPNTADMEDDLSN